MIFVLIIAVFIAFSYEPPASGVAVTGAVRALVDTVAVTAVVWLLAELFARVTARRLDLRFDERAKIMQRYQWLRWLHTAVLLGGYVWIIHGRDWPAVVRDTWRLGSWVLVDDVLVLAPFLAALVLSWQAQYRVDDRLRRGLASALPQAPQCWSRWSHLDFLLRHHLGIVLVPLLALLALDDVVVLVFRDSVRREIAELAVGLVGFAALIVFAPMLLRLLWGAEPLPAGPLRQRLVQLSRRLRFRASDILVWKTGGAVINAAVAGMFPWPRYVLLSDGLLIHLTEDEVEAVFGHEVGHIRHHHLWFYVAFLQGAGLVLLVGVATLGQLLDGWMGRPLVSSVLSSVHGVALPLGCAGIYFGVFFGFLSRRFERQADVFGCRAVSCGRPDCPPHFPVESVAEGRVALCPAGIRTFVGALEKIATLNGSMRDTRSWRHFSIARRVEFLQQLAERPDLEFGFQRVVLGLKLIVVAALIAAGVWAWRDSSALAAQVLGLRF